jgi:hypothetical protein
MISVNRLDSQKAILMHVSIIVGQSGSATNRRRTSDHQSAIVSHVVIGRQSLDMRWQPGKY